MYHDNIGAVVGMYDYTNNYATESNKPTWLGVSGINARALDFDGLGRGFKHNGLP